ncbi:MAG: RluA family pseudouridine synthase [Eubacteriaceae bacterium]|nr:RluA family pseudouridine synthase [Eubacteriaceae bacterium]
MIELVVSQDYSGSRLDRFLTKNTDLPHGALQRLIRKGDVKLNGKKANANSSVTAGDIIRIYAADVKGRSVEFMEGLPLPEVIYEDDFILAVNKPPLLASQPNERGGDCLSERIKLYLKDIVISSGGSYVPGVINRLDMNTSGIVLCAKTPKAARELSALIAEGKIQREYIAIVKGELTKTIKAIHYALPDEAHNKMLLSDSPSENSQRMESVFAPIKSAGGYTAVKAMLITGKKHQIRAQLAQLGYPVVGDMKYGVSGIELGMKRQALHCYMLGLTLWYDSSRLKLVCDLPRDMGEGLRRCGVGEVGVVGVG